ncbi:hypothetical protein FC093_13565 [Ilyomonas limi]|uniref:YdhG-like domain-containing protein n=1 Tax=Ilyomonas limi TaxID=2575867 RepID=A0A4V5UU56_9BACT|nr:DUF1801 domain-containing protein [Ilyomonas limi]TKK67773.1 hypothetical protein FC093_13565 [Ilyomonas limi]
MQPETDTRIDAYINKSAPFAQPILQHIRALVHQACPDATETIKWGMPFFEYKGIVCNMAAFKNHCSLGFFKAGQMQSAAELQANNEEGMGHLGRITSLEDLPADEVLISYIKEAAALNEAGVKKATPKKTTEKKELIIPDEITKALKTNEAAKTTFTNFPYSHKKEYVEWITEAKTETTRNKRLETMLEWLQEGKSRNWKYERK